MKSYKPHTASRRHMTNVDYSVLVKTKPFKALLKRVKKHSGRNNEGRITMRHQGGGNKNLYRLIDFKQNKLNVSGIIKTIEYDPYRSAFISLVVYTDGDKRYILTPDNIKIGQKITSSDSAPLENGMRTPLKRIPIGMFVHNIEAFPGRGGKLARSAGSSAQILANEDGYTHIQMPSGEIRRIPWDGYATIGKVSNPDYNLVTIGKAGRSRWLGIRPTVRGSVMNPVDHPYGGGEGRTQRGLRRPKTKWGKTTGGRKTRNRKKWSNKLIIKRRK